MKAFKEKKLTTYLNYIRDKKIVRTMCSSDMQTTIVKVHENSNRLLSIENAKSVLKKILKKFVYESKSIDKRRRKQFLKDVESLNNLEGVDSFIELHQNTNNENKFNIIKSKMAYTVQELQIIVHDNLANELKEFEESRSSPTPTPTV